MPFRQQRAALVERLLRALVEQVLRRVAVHHRLADDSAESAALRLFEKDVCGLGVNGREDQRRERAVTQQLVVKRARDFARVGRVFELALGREGVALEPLEQVPAIRADHLDLRRVQVRVDEAWGDQRVFTELDDVALRTLRPVAGAGDPAAVIDGEVAVFEVAV
jgi:hypothetical protein